jgi:hypothetical protein
VKPAGVFVITLLALPAAAVVLAGCQGVAVSGYGYTPVYGDYGYVGPWDGNRMDVEGGYFVQPPYGRPYRNQRDEDAHRGDHRDGGGRPESPAPERGRPPEHQAPDRHEAPVQRPAPVHREAPVQHATPAPVQRQAPRAIPPIPNQPRPVQSRGGDHRTKH